MWWIILIIVILIILLITVGVIAAGTNNSCNKPCNTVINDKEQVETPIVCADNTVLLSCGDKVPLKTCDGNGRIGNYQYSRVYKGVKTFVPFKPSRIEGGEYKTCIITSNKDEIDYAIIHKKEDGDLKPLPESYRKVYVIIY